MNQAAHRHGESGDVPFRSDRFFVQAKNGIFQHEKALIVAHTHQKNAQRQVLSGSSQ